MIHGIIFTPISANDYAIIYDGHDATSGRKLCKVISSVVVTWALCFALPIFCPRGVYVEGKDDEVETTILHREVGR